MFLSYRGLEASVEFNKEWRLVCQRQNTPLGQRAGNIIILKDDIFFQHFYSEHCVSAFLLSQENLQQMTSE
jgi:hypothetical protein